jgi:hypothetical protein
VDGRAFYRSLIVALASAFVILTCSSASYAQDAPVSAALSLEAERKECVTEPALKRAVEARLEREVFVEPSGADMLVEVVIRNRPAAAGFISTITLRGNAGGWLGTREIESDDDDCAALGESLSLVLALMVDIPKDELPKPRPELPAETTKPAPRRLRLPRSEFRRTRPPPAPPASRKPVQFGAGVAAVATVGVLPGIAPGVRAHVSVSPPEFWTTELGASLYRDSRSDMGKLGSTFGLMTADLSVCPLDFRATPWTVRGCALQTIGRIVARGYGFDANREESRFTYSFGVGAQALAQVTELIALRFGITAQVPAVRDRFFYADSSGQSVSIHRALPVIAIGELGIALRFR